MKRILFLFTLIVAINAALHSSEYLPPLEDASSTSNSDLQSLGESSSFADDGCRYKTVKRLRLRHCRNVSELPSSKYLPTAQAGTPVADIPVVVDAQVEGVAQSQDTTVLADDGYRYKTVKRVVYRKRV